jgi:lantibiotic biosynthesis protein
VWEAIANTREVWAAIDRLAALPSPVPDRALLASYLATVRDDDSASDALADLVGAFERGFERPALTGGLAGAAWVANHVAPESEELLAACDASLARALDSWVGPLDLTHGLVGVGIYFLDRESDIAARARARVVELLAARMRDGTWHTPPEELVEWQRLQHPNGVIDCGVPHGVGGIVGLLRRIDPASPLAEVGARWLLAQRQGDQLPAMVVDGNAQLGNTAWCYGAPGACLALGGVRELTGWLAKPAWPTDSRALCHGAAGLMHMTNRMYQATRDEAYRKTALTWLDRVLARIDEAPAGDLLDGSVGIALALLAVATDLPPAWDRMLLCDVVG